MVDGQKIRELCESYKREERRRIRNRVTILAIEWGLFVWLILWGDFQ
jgi:hypothetical protein